MVVDAQALKLAQVKLEALNKLLEDISKLGKSIEDADFSKLIMLKDSVDEAVSKSLEYRQDTFKLKEQTEEFLSQSILNANSSSSDKKMCDSILNQCLELEKKSLSLFADMQRLSIEVLSAKNSIDDFVEYKPKFDKFLKDFDVVLSKLEEYSQLILDVNEALKLSKEYTELCEHLKDEVKAKAEDVLKELKIASLNISEIKEIKIDIYASKNEIVSIKNQALAEINSLSDVLRNKIATVLVENKELAIELNSAFKRIDILEKEFNEKALIVKDAVDVVNNANSSISELKQALLNTEAIRAEIGNYNTLITNYNNQLTNIKTELDTYKDTFKDEMTKLKDEAIANIDSIEKSVDGAKEVIANYVEVGKKELANEVVDYLNAIQLKFAEFEDIIKEKDKNFTDKLNDLIQDSKLNFENQKNELVEKFKELEEKIADIRAFVDLSKVNIDNLTKEFVLIYETKFLEFEQKFNSLKTDVSSSLNDIILDIDTKKGQLLNEFNSSVDDNIKKLNDTKQDFLTTVEKTKEESIQEIKNLSDDLNKFILSADKLEEITFVQKDTPKQNEAKENDSWLDTSKGVINIYEKNPKVRFNQSDNPTFYASLYDTFHKNNKIADVEFNEFYMFLQTINGKEWLKTNEEAFKAEYQQALKPNADISKPNQTWFEMDYLEVYYRENNAWVQISKKLEQARFIQDTEPTENQNVKLNDIWKKSDDSFFMFVAVNEEGNITNKWIALEKVYLYAKFMQTNEPVSVEGKFSVDMFDLWFKCDFSKFYVYEKVGENGVDSIFDWTLLSEAKAKAKFKGEIPPNELLVGDLHFKHLANDKYQGEMFSYEAKSYEYRFVTLKAIEKYSSFKQEVFPNVNESKNDDILYRPYSKEYYILKDDTNSRTWMKLDLDKEATFKGDDDLSSAKVGDIYQKDENSQKLYYMKLAKECAWIKQDSPKHNPYIWKNKNTDRLEIIENLMSPEMSLEHTYKDILDVKYPQQFIQLKHLNDAELKIAAQARQMKEQIDFDLRNARSDLSRKIELVNYKCKFDYVDVTPNSKINFGLSNVFFFNAQKAVNKVLSIGAVPNDKRFSCGIICIYGCQFLKGFDGRFKFRIAQSGFAGSEIFSYWIHDINWIRLVRS